MQGTPVGIVEGPASSAGKEKKERRAMRKMPAIGGGEIH